MDQDFEKLVANLITLPSETEYLEFKEKFDKEIVGERISAISNSSLLLGREFGYIIFGVRDDTHIVVGTSFDPDREKVGNDPVKNWLAQMIFPRIDFQFFNITINNSSVVILRIPSAIDEPVKFQYEAYIRKGEATRKLREFPDLERKIWNNARNRNYEKTIAEENLTESEVLKKLDYDKFFQLTKQDIPSETRQFLERLSQSGIVQVQDDGRFRITVLGAILFGRDLRSFHGLIRKGVRIISYDGNTREKRKSDQELSGGYATSFEALVEYINNLTPINEEIQKALRVERKMYPELAIREFVANALIHQDISLTGTSPLVEVFTNRIEITNPGVPLIDVNRFIDHPPVSRNETLASLMRRFGFCEESGSGVDRALLQIEVFQLPAPKFESYEEFTKITLFAYRSLKEMSEDDKVRACYQHCVLKHLSQEDKMSNASLRARLTIEESNYPAASKIIKETIRRGLIKEGDKPKTYIPFWA